MSSKCKKGRKVRRRGYTKKKQLMWKMRFWSMKLKKRQSLKNQFPESLPLKKPNQRSLHHPKKAFLVQAYFPKFHFLSLKRV